MQDGAISVLGLFRCQAHRLERPLWSTRLFTDFGFWVPRYYFVLRERGGFQYLGTMTSGRRELTATAYLALRLLFDAIEKDHSLFDEPPDTIRARLDQLSRLLPREEKEDTRQLHELFIEQRKSLFCNLAAGPKKSNKTSSRTGRSRKTPSNRRNITQNKKAIHQQLQPQVTTFQWIAPSTQKPPQSQTANSKPSEQPIVNREIQIQRWQAYDPENKDGLSVYYELVNQQERLKAFFTRTPQSSIVAQNKKEQKEDHPILRLIDDNETPHRFFKHTLCGYASLFLFVDSQGYRGENEGTIQKDYLLLWEGRSKRVHKGLHFGEKVARLENKLPGAGMLAICLKEKLNNTSITQIDALCLYIKQDETLQRLLPLFSNAEGEQDFWDWAIGTGTARSKKLTSGSSELDSNFRHAISSSTTPAPNQSTTTCVDDGGDHSDGPRTTDCVTLSNSRCEEIKMHLYVNTDSFQLQESLEGRRLNQSPAPRRRSKSECES